MSSFKQSVKEALERIGMEKLEYNRDEFWMLERTYNYVKYYAEKRRLWNTAVALPVVRALHDGSHRKSSITIDGKSYRLPYVIHCLRVCRMLIDLQIPVSREEEDIVLASALCHDLIEDIEFPEKGREIVTEYGLDERIYETVRILSKRRDFTEAEHRAYFDKISKNRYAVLVKLADRGNNVEDLYNMSVWKVHEYVGETRDYFFPMCSYAKGHFKDLYGPLEILQQKMISLTEVAEILVDRYEQMDRELTEELHALEEENDLLWRQMRERENEFI